MRVIAESNAENTRWREITARWISSNIPRGSRTSSLYNFSGRTSRTFSGSRHNLGYHQEDTGSNGSYNTACSFSVSRTSINSRSEPEGLLRWPLYSILGLTSGLLTATGRTHIAEHRIIPLQPDSYRNHKDAPSILC
jgi:hypothetical protein